MTEKTLNETIPLIHVFPTKSSRTSHTNSTSHICVYKHLTHLRQYKLSPAQPWGVELDDLRSLPNTNHSVSLSTPARAPKGHLAADTQDSHCSSCSTLRVFPDFSIKPHLPTPSNKTSGTAQPRNCRNTPSICFLLTLTGLHQDFLHFLKLTASKYSLRGVSPQFTTHWCISRHVSLCCLAPSSSPSTNTM